MLCVIHGRVVMVGKERDGDSARLVADHPEPSAQLIVPRLVGRSTNDLEAVAGGFQGYVADWLLWVSTSPLPLSDPLVQANDKVRSQAGLLDIVVVENQPHRRGQPAAGLSTVRQHRGRSTMARSLQELWAQEDEGQVRQRQAKKRVVRRRVRQGGRVHRSVVADGKGRVR